MKRIDESGLIWDNETGMLFCPFCKTTSFKQTHGQKVLRRWKEGNREYEEIERRTYLTHICGKRFVYKSLMRSYREV